MKTFKTPKGTELPIMDIRGKDYLEVKFRLVWFREERPTWSIDTEFLSITDKSATAKATIRDEAGRAVATSHKFENAQGFPDFLEKSETGAIGRALALCGFGTQFCADELDEGDRLADSPVGRQSSVRPDQPTSEDGNVEPLHYKIPFGKWTQRTIEEVHRTLGEKAIVDYIAYIEDTAKKKGKPVTGDALEFIQNAERFLAAFEQGVALEMGARG
jgi:hypothetical protein